MNQNNNQPEEITANQLQFKAVATGSAAVYEHVIRTHHPKEGIKFDVIECFSLAYQVYRCCEPNHLIFVVIKLLEHSQDKSEAAIVHLNHAQMLKAKSPKVHELIDELLDKQRLIALDEVRRVLANRKEKSRVSSCTCNIEPDDIPF